MRKKSGRRESLSLRITHYALEPMNDHEHDYKGLTVNRLMWSLAITLAAMAVEAVGGWVFGSISLVSDAGHMLTHGFALVVALAGILIARLPVCHHRTFGLLRAEVLAALLNAVFLFGLAVWIFIESVERLRNPQEIMTLEMLAVAILGLAVNLVSIFLLEGSRKGDLNVQSVFAHMMADAVSSVAIVAAAIVIRFTGWIWLDPIVAMGIGVLIVVWAAGLLKESLRVLLEMAPKGRNVHEIVSAMRERFPEVAGVEHEHLWTITPDVILFSAHLTVKCQEQGHDAENAWLDEATHWLEHEFDVSETTLQVRWKAADEHPTANTQRPARPNGR